MLDRYFAGKVEQCQLCHSINTDGRTRIDNDIIAICNECSTTDESGTTFRHEGIYILATNPHWGNHGRGIKYIYPLNRSGKQ